MGNPHVLRLGEHFQAVATDFPNRTPFLSSGVIALYQRAIASYNVELEVSTTEEGSFEGHNSLEFKAVANQDIQAGALLILQSYIRDQDVCAIPYSQAHNISDEYLEEYIAMRKALDIEDAAKAGVAPDVLHADTLREHVKLTREGKLPTGDCSKTVVLSHPTWEGYGVFAVQDIKAGEVIEYGLMRAINSLNGDKCTYVFTWNKDGRRKAEGNRWCMGGSHSMFMNSDNPANARMYRLYDGYRYVVVAKRDIKAGEEVMHLYASSSWRKCFVEDKYLPKLLPVESASPTIQSKL